MKYSITDESKNVEGVRVYRIKATKDFGTVKEGALGGWIAMGANLSQTGNCWLYGDAVCIGHARITHNATASGEAIICGGATLSNSAIATDNARVEALAQVKDSAVIKGNAVISGGAIVEEHATVEGDALVKGSALIQGHAVVKDNAVVTDNALIFHGALIRENANVTGFSRVGGHSRVGEVCPYTPTYIMGLKYHITMTDDHMTIGCLTYDREFWTNLDPQTIRDSIAPGESLDVYRLWRDYKEPLLRLWELETEIKRGELLEVTEEDRP